MFGISVDRSDRVFDNFLSISERKHSSDSAALADLRKLRGIKGRRLRRACCDEALSRPDHTILETLPRST